MDYELMRLAFELLVTALAGVLWWNFRVLAAKAARTQDELVAFKLAVVEGYAKKDDIKDAVTQIGKSVERLEHNMERFFDLIDRKADKA